MERSCGKENFKLELSFTMMKNPPTAPLQEISPKYAHPVIANEYFYEVALKLVY